MALPSRPSGATGTRRPSSSPPSREGARPSLCSAARQAGHPVRAPVLAAHAVVDVEDPERVILSLHRPEPGVVASPEGARPVLLEVVALRDVRAGVGDQLAELAHREADP